MGCGSSQQYAEGEEYFFLSDTGIKNTGKTIEGDGGTTYGAIIINPKIPKRHQWTFKITSGGGQFIIGIDESSMKSCNDTFTPKSSHPNYGFFNGDPQEGYIYSYNIQNNDSVYGKGYAHMNHCNDNITMILDTTAPNPTLKYIINGTDQGMALRNITKDCLYRMAVYMTKGKNDAVIALLNYSCVDTNIEKKQSETIDPDFKYEERFYKSHSEQVIISDNGYTVSNPDNGVNTSVYGWIFTNKKDNEEGSVYSWKFKINGYGKTGFGVIEVKNEERDELAELDGSYDDFFYFKTSLKNYGIESASKCSSKESYKYGVEFKDTDVIEMILDCDGGYLSFVANDEVLGNAYRVDQSCNGYRMAVVLGQGAEVQLLSYNCK